MKYQKDHSSAFLIHISALTGYLFPMGGIIAPLIFWQIKKDESKFLDDQGKEAVNFNLSFFLYSFILGLAFIPFFIGSLFNTFSNIDQMHHSFHFEFPGMLTFIGGISLIGVLGLIRLALIILASIKANKGNSYQYPLTIKFIK